MSKKSGKEKITIKRLFQNNWYLLKYAARIDLKVVLIIIGVFIFSGIGFAFVDSFFVKLFIDMLSNHEVMFEEMLKLIVLGVIVSIVSHIAVEATDSWARARFIYMTGEIQEQLIQKTSNIDLMCYDNKEYFDDFVVAAAQSEDMIIEGIFITGQIIQNLTMTLLLGGLIMSINSLVAIFPILGFLVNMITRFKITQLEYEYDIEAKRIKRKADYSKRVFYQPEYTKEIKLSHIEVPLRRQFDEAIEEVTEKARKAGKKIAVLSLINWIVVFTFLSFYCVPMYLGYLALVKMSIGLGDVAAMNNSQGSIRGNLDCLNYDMVEFQKVGQFAERFRKFMDYEVQIENQEGSEKVPSGICPLEVKDMSFCYPGAKEDTLKHISMTVKPGERIALVGENGAGKSTFIKLLMRLYEVSDGEICYDGKNIKDFTTREYREIFGTVFQDFQMYAVSLAENVLMGEWKPEYKERILKALEDADFTGKLNRLEHGIETQMTREFDDEGVMLSGGESQKVAISRMFIKRGKLAIAILDEPSSALDPRAEYTLNRSMMKKAEGASVIFISHRLSTTRDADRIYMFEHGEIVEQGTHEELMALNGEYAAMFQKQALYYQKEVFEAV